MSARAKSTPSRASGRDAGPGSRSRRRREGPRVERIVLLRLFAACLVLAFLALIVKGGILAFGTPDQQAKRIDAAVDGPARSASPR